MTLRPVAARTSVLGGLGGGPRASLFGWPLELPSLFARYAELVVVPRPFLGSFGAAFAIALVIGSGALLWWLSRSGVEPVRSGPLSTGRGAAFLAVWALALLVITAVSGVRRQWYAFPFVPLFALWLAHLFAVTWGAVRSGRLLAAPALATAAALLILQGWWSGAGGSRLDDAYLSARAADQLTSEFAALLRATPDGSTVELDGAPKGRLDSRRTVVLAPYSLEAYAELAFPGRNARVVVKHLKPEPPPGPDELLILLVPRAVDEWEEAAPRD